MRVLVVAAEDSGSLHALHIIRHLKGMGDYTFLGTGSPFLSEEMELLYTARELSFVGMEEPLKLLRILKAYLRLKALVRRVDGLILVDYPGVNLRLASAAASFGVPVCYFVAPQVWAWAPWRMRKVRRVDALVCLFPFEERFFRERGVNAYFFGHPLAERLLPMRGRARERAIVLLPGSRGSEVRAHIPVMLEAASRLRKRYGLSVWLVRAPSVDPALFDGVPSWVCEIPFEDRYLFMSRASVAVSASGTATLELALLGVPTVVVYRASPVSWLVGKRMVKVHFLSIVNILAGRELFPELLQERLTADAVEREARSLLFDEKRRENIVAALERLALSLGGSEPYRKTAELFHEVLCKDT